MISWGPATPVVVNAKDDFSGACARVLAKAYATFAFDKLCYELCDHNSANIGLRYRCGNCYSFAIYVQQLLKDQEGLESHVIVGNVPKYFMRPAYKGICHAAVYVPAARTILDPSVYAPPIRLDGTPCTPSPGTVMHTFADQVVATVRPHPFEPYLVSNPLTGHNAVKIPADTPHVRVTLLRGGRPASSYDYVLRSVLNFDEAITKPVHTANKSIFRVTTDRTGAFLYKVELVHGSRVVLNDYGRGQTFSKALGEAWTNADLERFSSGLKAFLREAFVYKTS